MRAFGPRCARMGKVVLLLAAAGWAAAAAAADKAWLQQWQKKNTTWRALHLIGPRPERLDATRELIAEHLVPMRFNVLVLEVGYGFEFKSHP